MGGISELTSLPQNWRHHFDSQWKFNFWKFENSCISEKNSSSELEIIQKLYLKNNLFQRYGLSMN